MQPATARLVFLAFAAVMGLSMSSIFLVFTGHEHRPTFFVTAASFGALSLWGYTTKRDISGWGSFLFMGLIGIIIAMIVNIFLGSPALQFAISAIGVLVFAGLTAYDTQRLKHTYDYRGGRCGRGRARLHHRRAAALPRLHQPLHVPAAVHGQQPRIAASDRLGLSTRRFGAAFCLCAVGDRRGRCRR